MGGQMELGRKMVGKRITNESKSKLRRVLTIEKAKKLGKREGVN